jgi:hypothetical protein
MSTLTIHPKSEEQERALRAIFDAFNVDYQAESDETEYLMASKANRKALDKSIEQIDKGQRVRLSLDDLWK